MPRGAWNKGYQLLMFIQSYYNLGGYFAVMPVFSSRGFCYRHTAAFRGGLYTNVG